MQSHIEHFEKETDRRLKRLEEENHLSKWFDPDREIWVWWIDTAQTPGGM